MSGQNLYGQLGLGNHSNFRSPRLIVSLEDKSIRSVAAGENISIAVTEEGDLYCWGKGTEGSLGIGDCPNSVPIPRLITSLHETGIRIRKVVCGSSHTIAL